jgi:hypothetical protein
MLRLTELFVVFRIDVRFIGADDELDILVFRVLLDVVKFEFPQEGLPGDLVSAGQDTGRI